MKTLQVIEIKSGYTFDELRSAISELEGRDVPRTTLIDWIEKVCCLDRRSWYDPDDYEWLAEWVLFKRRFADRSPKKVKAFHDYLRSKTNAGTEARTA